MQEIAPHIFIEKSYPGVTLGAINWPHGLILIDAPIRQDDVRLWRSNLAAMNGGLERLLVNLDEHMDRTIGARQLECLVAGHEKLNLLFRDRPVTFKAQSIETGSDWELQSGLGSVRWAPPDISFSDQLEINWDEHPVILESRPGPSACSIWLELPHQRVVFVGDAVVPNAPPFLANADIQAWKETLRVLLSPKYKEYMLVSGRGGVVDQNVVKEQLKFLEKVENQLLRLKDKKDTLIEYERSAQTLLKNFDPSGEVVPHYLMRLNWGLQHYLRLHPNLE